MRYIIGLIPLDSTLYAQAAQTLYSHMSDGYLLSSTVYPHITLAQFELSDHEEKRIQVIWQDLTKFNINPFKPELIGIHLIKGLNSHEGFHWAQIGVERDPLIMKAHYRSLYILSKHQLFCLNDAGDIYKPHITLARIKLSQSIPLWPVELLAAQEFRLALGASDINGRYLHTLYE